MLVTASRIHQNYLKSIHFPPAPQGWEWKYLPALPGFKLECISFPLLVWLGYINHVLHTKTTQCNSTAFCFPNLAEISSQEQLFWEWRRGQPASASNLYRRLFKASNESLLAPSITLTQNILIPGRKLIAPHVFIKKPKCPSNTRIWTDTNTILRER